MSEKFDQKAYERKVLSEIQEEVDDHNLAKQRCRRASFVSKSRGKGRRREPREVDLLVVDNNHAYTVRHGRIMPRRNGNCAKPEELALEILEDLPWEKRTTARLLERAKR